MTDDVLVRWMENLEGDLVEELDPEAVASISRGAADIVAGLASGTAISAGVTPVAGTTAVGGAGAVAGISTAAKVITAALVATLGLATGAVTGGLPAPVQSWVADVVEKVGIDIPRPEDVPLVTIPDDLAPVPDLPSGEVPDVTIPGVDVPGIDVPSATTSVPDTSLDGLPAVSVPDTSAPDTP